MRIAFVRTLMELARADKNIVLITGDLGFTVFEEYKEQFPHQYVNIGVSEANMIGVAAGMALSGKTVFTYSIIPFAVMRPYEQIRNDVCYQNANVKIVGVGGGYSYSYFGATHHAVEDIGIMRATPNMTVVCPGDPWEAECATAALARMHGPAYLRLGKRGEPLVHAKDAKFQIGKGIIVKKGSSIALIATSTMLEGAIAAGRLLETQGVHPTLVSIHTIKPIDRELIENLAATHANIVTLEEHSIYGGLGSAVAETLAESLYKPKFKRLGILDQFPKTIGTQIYLRGQHGLNPEQIKDTVISMINTK